jgi:hypothetical protein
VNWRIVASCHGPSGRSRRGFKVSPGLLEGRRRIDVAEPLVLRHYPVASGLREFWPPWHQDGRGRPWSLGRYRGLSYSLPMPAPRRNNWICSSTSFSVRPKKPAISAMGIPRFKAFIAKNVSALSHGSSLDEAAAFDFLLEGRRGRCGSSIATSWEGAPGLRPYTRRRRVIMRGK